MKIFKKVFVIFVTWMVLVQMPFSVTGASARTLLQNSAQTSTQTSDSEQEQKKNTVTTQLVIDNQNRYEGMDKTYSEGYIPKVEQGIAYLVVPLSCNGELKDNRIRVALNLGDFQTMPFVSKNYEKYVSLQQVQVNDGTDTVEGYVAVFSLELKQERYNGSYPVILTAHATDTNGTELQQEFTIYVNITDGKNVDEEPATETATEEPVTFAPKVLVDSCQLSKTNPQAGEEVTAEITLVNTSQSEAVQNMTVTIAAQSEYFTLLSQSDSIYVGSIPAGGSTVVSYDYAIHVATPQGQYDLNLTMDYADSKGGSYSGTGTAKLSVGQPMRMQFDALAISNTVQVADIIEAQVQAMNLGRSKVYNVRAVIEADGLVPEGTLFIGDMEAGTMQTGSIRISVTSLSNGNASYGKTTGTVTFYYEDEAGNEYEEYSEFTTNIQSPFSNQSNEEPDQTGQWWVIMIVIIGILIIIAVIIVIRKIKCGKRQEEGMNHEVVE